MGARMVELKPGLIAIQLVSRREVVQLGRWNTCCSREYACGLLGIKDMANDLSSLHDHCLPLAFQEAHRTYGSCAMCRIMDDAVVMYQVAIGCMLSAVELSVIDDFHDHQQSYK